MERRITQNTTIKDIRQNEKPKFDISSVRVGNAILPTAYEGDTSLTLNIQIKGGIIYYSKNF